MCVCVCGIIQDIILMSPSTDDVLSGHDSCVGCSVSSSEVMIDSYPWFYALVNTLGILL